ncbi:MAG: hypothetical protein L0H64_21630, partial [Pseudonocardia sp.]|nr:hypothetical protein [Pseudonocardia sp.]
GEGNTTPGQAPPAIRAAVAWTVLPGVPLTYALGMRGVTAWGIAPTVAIGSSALAAVLAGLLGVPWSAGVAVAPALLAAAVIEATRLRRRSVPGTDGVWVGVAAAVGLTVAVVIGLFTVTAGIGVPSRLSHTYDAVFHYSAVARILADGPASSLTLGTLTSPAAEIAFYPAAWHDVVSLVVLVTGASIPVASNAVVVAVTCVVWPLGATALVRSVCGPAPVAVALAPVLALGFVSFPWALTSFGVLWPNLIGVSLLPAALAVVLTLCGLTAASSLGRGRAALLLPAVVVTLGLAHPNTLFSLAVLAVFPVGWWLGRLVLGQVRTGRRAVPVVEVVAALAGGTAVVWFLLTSPVFDELRAFDWPAYQGPVRAVGEVVLVATNDTQPAWAVAVVVLFGLVAAWLVADRRWLVPAHLASGTLFVLASSQETELAAAVTAFWYNDSYRLAAVIPVTGVLLAVLGITGIGTVAHRIQPARVPADAVALGTAAVVLAASGAMYVGPHADVVRIGYPPPEVESDLLTAEERDFFAAIDDLIEPGSVVAQNPWSGSSLLWPLTGHEVLFPHLGGDWTADQLYLARNLNDAATDPRVCRIARRLDVRYVLTGAADFWLGTPRAGRFPGLTDVDGPGFVRLAGDGNGNALYELTACGRDGSLRSGPLSGP